MFSVLCFKQKTAYEMRISDWSSDVCSSDLQARLALGAAALGVAARPLEFLLDRLLARLLLRVLALEAVVLLHQPVGVVALPRDAAAAVELQDPFGGVVEEVAVMGHRHPLAGLAEVGRAWGRERGWP